MAQAKMDGRLGGAELAYQIDGGADEVGRCGFFFLGGFKSDMTGRKAEALAELARATRRRTLRFDYSGHGQSGGIFGEQTISDWLEQSVHMMISHSRSKVVVVGSSMGGWLALLLARRLAQEDKTAFRRIAGLVLLAPAADMTQELMWNKYSEAARAEIRENGVYFEPSAYGEPYEITARLLTDGLGHLILKDGMELPFPVRIIQGTRDEEVPVDHAVKTFEALTGPDISLTLVKNGDHRLSSPNQIKLICDAALSLAERADGVNY
ncbi:alpha/beta hydrolase [Aestuariivirga litoralis]|uniref:alpha/beta hydrolase n=1 Tax=Aestuariivirga litoralis TaxID=2650924 RepID=UPI0018C5FFEA|nr:alpha/beta hydrolase [Aestuariivirga litoralis]